MEKIVRQTLSDQVYGDLKELLQAGEMEPGQRFTLRGLAAAIGTSAMPVREAVTRLAAEQALEVLPNRAIRVPLMTRERFLELRTIRLQLECLAIEAAADKRDDNELAEIQRHEQEFLQARAQPTHARRYAPTRTCISPSTVARACGAAADHREPVAADRAGAELRPGQQRRAPEPGRGPSAPPRHGRRHRKTRSRRRAQALHADLLSASEYILARELLP